ncbi:peptidase domain-containing ABC transporter [Tenacibaculum mesophilum]|uniref:peptidase domain-containing ABC transporter n=1 Tax=Tenacibaculum mesophilum TaxID=104268 RepID=UPI000649DA9C|nr:peptidase domain-containing ABC transporter [Tenacibaculum mesophilum]
MIIKKKQFYHIQQQDQSDCGIICLQTILKHYNAYIPLEKLREYSGASKQGTTMLGLMQCGNKIGLGIKGYESTIQALKGNKTPAILHTIFEEKLQHYIVCFGYDNKKEKFVISNPASSKIEYLTEKELDIIWQTKALLLCKETDKLVKKKAENKQKWQWIYKYVKEDINLLSMSLFLGILLAVLSLATAIYSQKLIDILLPSKDTFKIIASICLLFFLFTLQVFFSYLRNLFLIRQTNDYNTRVINFFYNNLLRLPKTFFDTRKTGDMVARMNDTSRIQKTISKIIGSIVIDILLTIVVSIAIFSYNQTLGFITLLWIPTLTIVVVVFNPKIKKQQKEVMQSYARNESNYIDTIKGIETIKNNNKEAFFTKETNSIYELFQKAIYDLGRIGLNYTAINESISNIFITGTLGYSVYLVLNKQLTAGVIIAILQLVGILMASTSNLALINIEIQEAKIAFNRMFEFTSIEKEKQGTIELKNFEHLQINDLSFRFAGRSQLLKKVNLTIKKGELSAIVGESGSGKSTLGQILQKFYDFENGTIIVNKKEALNDIELTSWRNLVGVVPQEITIFNGNVLDNILLGKEDTPENVVKFCQEHGFEEFVKEFPQGYTTILGEEGVNLSGGQKQIIALARVLYKKPQLLILDEATAAMDRKTEKFSIQLITRLKEQMGVLFISHRIETLKKYADTIYVLEKGETTIKGNHKQLLETSNFYSDYWKELA